MEAKIQFIKGLDEQVSPDIRLTRSRDGSTGTATFKFKKPNILDKRSSKEGEITGMYLIDEEGTLETRDVSAMFIKGKPEVNKINLYYEKFRGLGSFYAFYGKIRYK